MSELKPCPECGGPAEVCGTSYADRHYEHRRAPSPAVDRLVEAAHGVIADHAERMDLYPAHEGQGARVRAMRRLKSALAAVEAEKEGR